MTVPTSRARASWAARERLVLGVCTIVALLVVWEGLSRGWWADALHPALGDAAERLRVKPIFISSPSRVALAAWRLYFVTGEIWRHIAASGLEIIAGLGLAVVTGIPFGLWAGSSRYVSYAVEPFMSALNATPQIAFLPLIVLWIGTGFAARALIIFLLTLLPILMNAHAAARTVDPRLTRLARSFCASRTRVFATITLPSSVPFLLAGLRLSIGRAMIGIVVGELYGAAIGVGFMINKAGSLLETDTVFVGVFTIVIAGLALTELVRHIETRAAIWRPRAGGRSSS